MVSKNFLLACMIFQVSLMRAHSIVLVHIGDTVPSHLSTCVEQLRMFNTCDIYLVAGKKALEQFKDLLQQFDIKGVSCESLTKSEMHELFLHKTRLATGFWRYATERFFYLDELIRTLNLTDVFHMEYDNMLYVNLSKILVHFQKNYEGIAATFDNDNRCIPGFMYLKSGKYSSSLARFIALTASDKNDMETIALYWQNRGKKRIDFLPIICPEYCEKYGLISPSGKDKAGDPYNYVNGIKDFDSVFDAAALGQYLGGIDPICGPSQPGFINESCLFNPSLLTYVWKMDHKKRKIPYMVFQDKMYRINNLHIHSKKLRNFLS